jgi:phosphatidylcholine synthase
VRISGKGSAAGFAVHVLTATGAVCGLFALHYAAAEAWATSFLWLGIAAVVDAADGPIARKISVETMLPRFSGVRLDLVVDYLNYCVVPAFIVAQSGIAGEGRGLITGAIILLSSLFHFADLESKTDDGFFVGFPAIWNVVCLYFFVFETGPVLTCLAITLLATLTFLPIAWVHPLRVRQWRPATLVLVLAWSGAAVYETLMGFPQTFVARAVFATVAVYIVVTGVRRTARGIEN